jgi:ubiquitin-activating enzyme E1
MAHESVGVRAVSDTDAKTQQRYSRQIYAVGQTAMRRVLRSSVAIIGAGAVGTEVAKNLLLSGCPRVTLIDATPMADTGTRSTEANYFLHGPAGATMRSENEIGSRANAVLGGLVGLNSSASVRCLQVRTPVGAALSVVAQAYVSTLVEVNASVVVLADPLSIEGWSSALVATFADACHSAGLPLVLSETFGLYTRVFNDFGGKFVVEDPEGEEPHMFVLLSWELLPHNRSRSCVKATLNTSDHNLPLVAGDKALLRLPGLAMEVRIVSRTGSDTLVLDAGLVTDDAAFATFWDRAATAETRVTVTELREAITLSHASFADPISATADKFTLSFTSDPVASCKLFDALHEFHTQHCRLPRPASVKDSQVFAGIASSRGVTDVDAAETFARTAAAETAGMAAFVGGVVSQEALKAVTRRYVPVTQRWHYDFRGLLSHSATLSESDEAAQVELSSTDVLFGKSASARLRDSNLFVVGAGAIGCEYLKNLALMGCGMGPKGRITVTDPDSIEVSNLSRQFLFREHHVGSNKAETAAAAIKAAMGPKLKIRALRDKVAAATADPVQGVFNARFWAQTDVICTAVDNIAAREFLDSCAARYEKPMIDSGTQAAMGHVEVFAPHASQRFTDANTPADTGKAVPFCTLHFFPTSIEHCIQFGQELFNGRFTTNPQNANRCLAASKVAHFAASLDAGVRMSVLRAVHTTLVLERPTTTNCAVKWARQQFEVVFVHPVLRLLDNYPPGKLNEDGTPYWSGSKRPPRVTQFDLAEPDHRAFIVAAASLWGRVFGLPAADLTGSRALQQVLDEAVVPAYERQTLVVREPGEAASETPAEQSAAAAAAAADNARVEREAAELTSLIDAIEQAAAVLQTAGGITSATSDASAALAVEIFEKDDDANFHVAFLTAVSNIRARAYGIPCSDFNSVKRIAGRIVPAMITTTAVVTGIATLMTAYIVARNVTHKTAAAMLTSPPASPLQSASKVLGRAHRVVLDCCTNPTVNLVDLVRTQSFEILEPSTKPFFVVPNGNAPQHSSYISPRFSSWDTLSLCCARHMTLRDVLDAVPARFHGLSIVQLVEDSTNTWVFDSSATAADARALDFPLVDWTAKLAGIPLEDLDRRKELRFVLRCAPPEAAVAAFGPNVKVHDQLPLLVLCW